MNRLIETNFKRFAGRSSRVLLSSVSALILCAPGLALAQSPNGSGQAAEEAGASQGAGGQLEEIVVTAEKRTSTVQVTPISITAVTGAALDRQGITEVATLVSQIPGVSFESEGPGKTQFDMRGLSGAGGSAPTVGFYLDDVPISPPTSQSSAEGKTEIDPNLYDLARVEVLRGPQGTLYGASSMGGTIRLITKDPKLGIFEGSAQSGLSGTQGGGVNYDENVVLNIPIGEQLALRVVGSEKYNSGFIDQIVLKPFPFPNGNSRGNVLAAPVQADHSNVNDDRTQGVRAKLLFQPIDELTIESGVFAQKLAVGGISAIDSPPGSMASYTPDNTPEGNVQSFYDYSLKIKYALPDITIESITSGVTVNDTSYANEAENLYYGFGPVNNYYLRDNNILMGQLSHEFNEELRVSSSGDSPFQWIAGLFYSAYNEHFDNHDNSNSLIKSFGTNNIQTLYEIDHLYQRAAFGEVNYQIIPELKLTAGLRYFTYTSTYEQSTTGIVAVPGFFSGTAKASGVLPKVTLTYTPDKDLLFYATASKGFRPGGPNVPVPLSGPGGCASSLKALGLKSQPLTYQPDSVWNYEIGEKASLFDGKVRVNSSLYHIDWSGIQQQVTLGCGFLFTANAGTAVSEGGESEIEARLAQGLTLSQSIGYTKATLTKVRIPGNSPLGQQLPDVPKWTFSTTLSYSTDLVDDLTLDALLVNKFVDGEYDYSGLPAPYIRKPPYDVVDARIGLDTETWSTYLYIDNLLDRQAVLGIDRALTLNDPWHTRLVINRPRTFGVVASVKF
jgi:outer membrane receptor protein involved in Fe transport